ncbi:MAG: extracellular solute-binding protein [Bowdeniella nasicola]|nr:extracellular solute-binding protein [Bowdeniella nasicola]
MSIKKTGRVPALVSVLAAATLVLAGCGNDGEKTEKATEPDAGADSSGETVEIEYWHRLPDGEGMVKVQESVDRFNAEHDSIKVSSVKFEGKPQESYAKIQQAVKAGNAPCLAQIGYGEVASEYLAGDLMDVSEYAEEYASNYSEGAMGMMTLGDVVVGLPQDTGPLVYIYDKDAFDELGIEAPTTWEEFKSAAETAKEAGKYIGTWQADETQYRMSGMAAAAGGTWFNAEGDAWKVDANGEASQKVAEIQQDLLDNDLLLPIDRWSDDFNAKLADGTIIGSVAAAWEPAFVLDVFDTDGEVAELNWQVAQLPEFTPGTPATGSDGGSGVAVISGCEHPAEALEFANWYNTQVDDLVSQGLVVATNQGEGTTPDAWQKHFGGQDVYAELLKANENLNPNFPYAPTWPAVGTKMNEIGGEVKDGSATVMDIFEAAQSEALSSLKAAGVNVTE